MVFGSASNVLFASTSLTTNLNNPVNVPNKAALIVNSPAETAPNSNVSTNGPWDYTNAYTVIVSKAAFGAGTFGSVGIVGVHNSPAKKGSNLVTPTPGNGTVVNTATVSAFNGTIPITVSDTATLQVVTASSILQGNVTAGTAIVDKNKVTVPLMNQGTAKVVLSKVVVNWPTANGKDQKVFLAGKVLYDTATLPNSLTITHFKGSTGDRSIDHNHSKSLVFQFEKNAALSGYTIDLTFTDGSVLHIVV